MVEILDPFDRPTIISSTGDILTSAKDPRPEKMSLTKVDDPLNPLEVLLNPSSMEEVIAANYRRLDVIGQSHKPMQYLGTDNHKFRIEIFLSASGRGKRVARRILDNRQFLMSLMYPRRASPGAMVPAISPPRVLFFWPEMISLTALVPRVSISHEMFWVQGSTRQMRCAVEIEEVRDFRLLSEDVARSGTLRLSGATDDDSIKIL
jgi:hypothetical protein